MSRPAFAETSLAISQAKRERWEEGAAERRRRHLVHLIDLAIGQCEERNLASTGDAAPAPGWVADLVERLAAATGLPANRPRTSIEAHGALLDLQAFYLPDVDRLDEDEEERS